MQELFTSKLKEQCFRWAISLHIDQIVYTDWATVWHNGKLGTVKEVWLWIYFLCADHWFSFRVPGISNNEAEFLAVIKAMELCIHFNAKSVEFRMDSKIVYNRCINKWPKVKWNYELNRACTSNLRMDEFQSKVFELAKQFNYIGFKWVPREWNTKADELSKLAVR